MQKNVRGNITWTLAHNREHWWHDVSMHHGAVVVVAPATWHASQRSLHWPQGRPGCDLYLSPDSLPCSLEPHQALAQVQSFRLHSPVPRLLAQAVAALALPCSRTSTCVV